MSESKYGPPEPLPTSQDLVAEQKHYGPAMRALNPRQQAFVSALFLGLSNADCYRVAYDKPNGEPKMMASCSYHLLQNPKIGEAIVEQTKYLLKTQGPAAYVALMEIIGDKFHAKRLDGIKEILSRVDPTTQKIDVEHSVKFDPVKINIASLRHLHEIGASHEMLLAEFHTEHGLAHYEALLAAEDGNVIDAEFKEIEPPDVDADLGL